jgi:hypothetical protein
MPSNAAFHSTIETVGFQTALNGFNKILGIVSRQDSKCAMFWVLLFFGKIEGGGLNGEVKIS